MTMADKNQLDTLVGCGFDLLRHDLSALKLEKLCIRYAYND